jgi:membrane-associated protease RseP (regulator of RpoE activity)
VVAILAVHEAAHRAMSRRSGTAPPTPFVIPGVPLVTSFLPSLGIISQQREPAVNRNRFFDYMVAGPLAALGLTLALYVAGELTSAASTLQAQGCQMVNGYITACQVNPSVFQVAVDWAVSGFAPAATAASRLSPLADAASVGFLLTFVGLLPLAFFDGGFIASAVLEDRFGRLATYLGVLALILFDTPNYWALAIVVLLMAGRPVSVQTYDEVSPISRSRRILFVALIAVALLSLPFPQNLGTFPLA